ncbi:MAG: hypothetical protein LBG83_00580 [Oscillospiraceae bacterium]|jgi:hypothetical protein|nr:hypothetical protein [Oscillospiraceae bacterium]
MKRNMVGFLGVILLALCLSFGARAEPFNCAEGRHDYEITTREPTETEEGQTIYCCRLCGFTLTRTLPARGHEWSAWETELAPTCTQPGRRYRVCTSYANAPHREEEAIPALGHQWQTAETPPTCIKDGAITQTCARCGAAKTIAGRPAAGHRYAAEITKQATCESAGETTFTCVACGASYSERIPALGHAWGEWEVLKPASETEEGLRRRVCANGHSEEAALRPLPAMRPAAPQTTAAPPPEPPPKANYTADIALLTATGGAAAGMGWGIAGDLRILRWGKRGRLSYLQWLAGR